MHREPSAGSTIAMQPGVARGRSDQTGVRRTSVSLSPSALERIRPNPLQVDAHGGAKAGNITKLVHERRTKNITVSALLHGHGALPVLKPRPETHLNAVGCSGGAIMESRDVQRVRLSLEEREEELAEALEQLIVSKEEQEKLAQVQDKLTQEQEMLTQELLRQQEEDHVSELEKLKSLLKLRDDEISNLQEKRQQDLHKISELEGRASDQTELADLRKQFEFQKAELASASEMLEELGPLLELREKELDAAREKLAEKVKANQALLVDQEVLCQARQLLRLRDDELETKRDELESVKEEVGQLEDKVAHLQRELVKPQLERLITVGDTPMTKSAKQSTDDGGLMSIDDFLGSDASPRETDGDSEHPKERVGWLKKIGRAIVPRRSKPSGASEASACNSSGKGPGAKMSSPSVNGDSTGEEDETAATPSTFGRLSTIASLGLYELENTSSSSPAGATEPAPAKGDSARQANPTGGASAKGSTPTKGGATQATPTGGTPAKGDATQATSTSTDTSVMELPGSAVDCGSRGTGKNKGGIANAKNSLELAAVAKSHDGGGKSFKGAPPPTPEKGKGPRPSIAEGGKGPRPSIGKGVGPPPPPAEGGKGPRVSFASSAGTPKANRPSISKANAPTGFRGSVLRGSMQAPPTKQLNWQKMGDVLDNTVWAKYSTSDPVKLEQAKLEHIFARVAPAIKQKDESPAKSSCKVLTTPQRSMLMGLSLSKFSKLEGGYKKLRQAIIDLDEDILTEDVTEIFLRYDKKTETYSLIPTEEESNAAQEYLKSSPEALDQLDECGKFIVAMIGVPLMKERLTSHLTRISFDERFDKKTTQFETLINALHQVKASEKLAMLLVTVLRVGNMLNAGTAKGDAKGFSLQSLSSIAHVKQVSGGSLVNYVAECLQTQRPDVLTLASDLADLQDAIAIDFGDAQLQVRELKKELADVSKFLERDAKAGNASSSHMTTLSKFVEEAELQLVALQDRQRDVELAYQGVVTFFGEAPEFPKKIGVQDWLKNLTAFLLELRNAVFQVKENRDKKKRRIAAEVSRRQKKHKAKKKVRFTMQNLSKRRDSSCSMSPLRKTEWDARTEPLEVDSDDESPPSLVKSKTFCL